MKKHKSGLYIATFVFLICVFTPYIAHAQEDGPVPWPCNWHSSYGLTSPWPCALPTQNDGLVSRHDHALAQEGGRIPPPYAGTALSDRFVPRPHNIFASTPRSMGDEILCQHALFEDRREEFAWIRS